MVNRFKDPELNSLNDQLAWNQNERFRNFGGINSFLLVNMQPYSSTKYLLQIRNVDLLSVLIPWCHILDKTSDQITLIPLFITQQGCITF